MSDDQQGKSELAALRTHNAALREQLKRLVRTEQRLSMSRTELSQQLRRVDALNQFTMRAVVALDARAILESAMDMLLSLFPFEQGLALIADVDGALHPMAVGAVPGREADSRAELERLASHEPLTITVPEDVLASNPSKIRERHDDSGQLLDMVAEIYGLPEGTPGAGTEFAMILPLYGPPGRHRSAIVLRRPPVPVNFHDKLPEADDRPFLNLVGKTVGAALTNALLIASLKQSVADLERAQRDLVAQERLAAIGELAAVVAHEVRNPLGAIFNSLANLRRLVTPKGDISQLLDIMREEASRVNRIVGDLLDFARPAVLDKHDHALSPIAEDAVESATADARARGVAIRLEADEGTHACVDEHLFRRALLNLIDNATQASDEGDLVHVRVSQRDNQAIIEVIDTGAGIGHETLDQIFVPFFTTKSIGTGLGLAVVKRFADSHGGEVLIRSSPNTGSVFTILLDGG